MAQVVALEAELAREREEKSALRERAESAESSGQAALEQQAAAREERSIALAEAAAARAEAKARAEAIERLEVAPPPPPPVRAEEDLESIVELTPEQALHGTTVELNLEDGTVVELDTPPQAGDGWRLRLEGVASGGRDHFLQLRVLTDNGLRIDGLRVHFKLLLYPPDAALGCAVEVPTLDGPVTLQVPPGSSSGRLLRLRGRRRWRRRRAASCRRCERS